MSGHHVSPCTGARWEPVIGLEVHAQLATSSKLFCGCAVAFGGAPNTRVCEVCAGLPGALPVLNRGAVDLAVRAGLALGCEVAPRSRFDRKSYFYGDLPKGFQITQFDAPLCRGGDVALDGGRRVGLERVHLEEDAGRTILDAEDPESDARIDLNRAGIGLIEVVTLPELASGEEAAAFLAALREILRYAGVSDADFERGSLRCDVNVSVRRPGEALRTRVEVKNLNSFRHVRDCVASEVARQVAGWESGSPAAQPARETRAWDADRGATRAVRSKEDAADYRYAPEPDLPDVLVGAARLERERLSLPELPAARRARYVAELGLSPYDASVLVADRATAEFFEAVARLSRAPKSAANWVTNDLARLLGDPDVGSASVDELRFKPHDLAELIRMVDEGRLHREAARAILRTMALEGGRPRRLAQAYQLEREDPAALEALCRAALAERPEVGAAVRGGNAKALGACVGPVLERSGGRADPRRVLELLRRLIEAGA